MQGLGVLVLAGIISVWSLGVWQQGDLIIDAGRSVYYEECQQQFLLGAWLWAAAQYRADQLLVAQVRQEKVVERVLVLPEEFFGDGAGERVVCEYRQLGSAEDAQKMSIVLEVRVQQGGRVLRGKIADVCR